MIVRHEQALETLEISEAFCGLNIHAWMITETVFTICRFFNRPTVVVIVAVAVGTVIASSTTPVVVVVVVVTVLCC